MYLADEEHHVDGSLERRLQAPVEGESLSKGAPNQIGSHEHGQSGPVLIHLEFAWLRLGASRHDRPVALSQQAGELPELSGRPAHLPRIRDDTPRSSHVVGVRCPVPGNLALENDSDGLVHQKLRPFDEVREVRLEERQRRPTLCIPRRRGPDAGRTIAERLMQHVEQLQPIGIVGTSPAAGDRHR